MNGIRRVLHRMGSIGTKQLPTAFLLVSGSLLGAQSQAEIVTTIGANFTASTYGADSPYVPPDCDGAAGPNHYVEFINGRFSVFSKSGGSAVQSFTDLTFWSRANVAVPPGWGVSDPRLVYDPTAQRWFASQIDLDPSGTINTNHFLLAVSAGPDPTGAWAGVIFPADTNGLYFADFPTLGVDAQGAYLTGNMFDAAGSVAGAVLVSIPKSDLLGSTPTVANRSWFGLLDPATYGMILQPAVHLDGSGGAEPVLAVGDVGLDFQPHSTLVAFSVQNNAPGQAAQIGGPVTIHVPAYTVPINPPQPNGQDNLDDGDARLSAAVYQVGGVLYAAHAVEVGNHAAIRWYKINAADYSLIQAGTIADPKLHLFYPSITANAYGTVVIAFNGCSTNTYVSSYAAVGETIHDMTTFGSPILLKSGAASYTYIPSGSTTSRWGDYTTTCVDPADAHRFWTIQMYPSSSGAWSTQVTELLTATPQLSIARSGADAIISWPGTAGVLTLMSTDNLSAPNWVPMTAAQTTVNGQVVVDVPTTAAAQFFRLQTL